MIREFIDDTSRALACDVCENMRGMRGDRDNHRDRDSTTLAAERLRVTLDAWEETTRAKLNDPSAARTPRAVRGSLTRAELRRLDLTDMLEAIATARAELVQCPEGAALAEAVLGATLHRLRLDAEYGKGRYQDGIKGARAPRHKPAAVELHARIRARAAELGPSLTSAAKANILTNRFQRSPRQIRRILSK